MYRTRLLLSAFLAAGFVTDAFGITKKKFDFVVGVDGDFKAAIAAAAAANPSENNRFIIFFPDGEYNIGSLTGDSNQRTAFQTSHVSIVGQSADKAVVYNKSINEGISTTATLYFPKNSGIYMQDLTLLNKANYGNENNCGSACRHVALQTIGDKFIFKNVKLLSTQDTYYTKKSGAGRTYWEGGQIEGTVDFICGDGDVWFEGTNLVMRRSGGYLTAAQTSTSWGYVFNNAKINVSNSGFNGTFYLGRSWGHAKTVFLNTTMYALPTAEGWGPDMNSAPEVYGEYNSKNGNGGAVDVSRRKTYFDGHSDPSTAKSLKTVWNASDAAKYTLTNVLGGSDKWEPNKLTVQMGAPKISQDGADIVWADDENARCWAVFVNGKFKTSVATNSISTEGIAVGSKVTVRAANSMGGLGATSNEISVLESNVTYYNVKLNESIGGTVETSLSSDKVAEGKTVTFTAKPADGWKFAGWTGASAGDLSTTDAVMQITASRDIELGAAFTASGVSTFQAESGVIVNGINESTNAGFAGSGYVNFGAGNSNVKVPVYTDAAGTYKMEMYYANGSTASRDLIIKALGGTSASSVTLDSEQQITFEKTTDWKTYIPKETEITLPKGASYIQFAVVGSNDGPNLDQIILTPLAVEDIPDTTSKDSSASDSSSAAIHAANGLGLNVFDKYATTHVFTIQGKLVRSFVNGNFSMKALHQQLPAGIYLIKRIYFGETHQKIIRIAE